MATLTRGERFKDARTTHNQHGKQTMKAVETATGVSASLIKDLEDDNSTRSVGYDKVAVLAKHYGVCSDWLLGLYPYPRREVCAVDELGLSPDTIDKIKRSKNWGDQDFLDNLPKSNGATQTADFTTCDLGHGAFNLLISSTLDDVVYSQISLLARRIAALSESELPEHLVAHPWLRARLGGTADDISAGVKLSFELYEKYPDLAGLFHVQFGLKSLKIDLEDICDTFRKHIEEITGYRAFADKWEKGDRNTHGNN